MERIVGTKWRYDKHRALHKSKSHTRSYAANAYYLSFSKRLNLTAVTEALVDKILVERMGVIATGAQYTITNGTSMQQVKAEKEIILYSGSIGSPQIIMLSGIGNQKSLRKYGIDILVANENVGENLQDHVYVPIG